jgi:hypothetical protein
MSAEMARHQSMRVSSARVSTGGLAVGLKAELLLSQQFAHHLMARALPQGGKFGRCPDSSATATSSRRETSCPSRPALCGRRPKGGRGPAPRRHREFVRAAADGARGDACDPRHCRNAAVTGCRGCSSCEQPPPAFGEMAAQSLKTFANQSNIEHARP